MRALGANQEAQTLGGNPTTCRRPPASLKNDRSRRELAESLGAHINDGEIRTEIRPMACGKALGTEGLPVESYAAYKEILATHLADLYKVALAAGALLPALCEALIVPLLKPRKPATDVSLYRLLSMLNVDYNILSEILVQHLSPYMNELIHSNQSGFLPDRSTALNIQRLLALFREGARLRDRAKTTKIIHVLWGDLWP
ncbi:hypothetical protein NDU88_003550 [Pleurodeles waltl]|uniref:Reverse transcriptase domain-containing protein n=1 Tax=Pleurodeles waltl TaxID=8319 RepID=A0AAV7TPH0_PLEWA|nr:hypothetical protein NDU88_003550 [Pleurodeles waltl]